MDPDGLVGVVVGGSYRLGRFCGNGAFGWVFEAEELVGDDDLPGDEVVGRCALKLLQPRDSDARASVLREMRAGAALTRGHQGLLSHLAFGKVAEPGPLHGYLYLTMELAEGSLGERLRQPNGRLSVAETEQMARHVAEALVWLHGRGAVHRDIKPDNVLYADGHWKLGDLGLVRPVDGSLVQTVTRQGTPLYVAPEALEGQVGPVSDVWSLGVMLQECLTGVLAYTATSELALYGALATREPTIAPDLPPLFDAVVRGCLVKDPRKRWTAKQVLEGLSGGAPPQSASAPAPAPGAASVPAVVPTRHRRKPRRLPDGQPGAASVPAAVSAPPRAPRRTVREMVQELFDHPVPWVVLAWLLASLDVCRRYMNSYELKVSDGFGSIALIFLGTTMAVTLPIPLLRKAVSAAERILEKWAWEKWFGWGGCASFVVAFCGMLITSTEHSRDDDRFWIILACVAGSVLALCLLSFLLCRMLLWLRDVAGNPVPWVLPGWLVSGTVGSSLYLYGSQVFRHESNEGLARIVLLVLAVAAFATVSALQWLRLALHQQD